jgi:AraC family transcriptional regulator
LIADVAKRMWRHEESGLGDTTVVERGMGFIMGLVLSRQDPQRVPPRRTQLPDWQLNKALKIMHDRKLSVSVSELADCVGMSIDHFIRSFKAATGLSPGQKIRSLCLQEAMVLLRRGQMSITEISMELGFSSPSHFATFFRSQTGDAPSEWLAHQPQENRRH